MSSQSPINVHQGVMRRHWFFVLQHLLLGMCNVLIRMDRRGLEHVPKTGGYIIVSNHLHNLDGVFIDIATPRPVHYMAKSELFANRYLARLLRWGGVFPINRGKVDRQALRHARGVVDAGLILGMFPEGTRSRTMQIEKVLPGAGLIAVQNRVPIIPVAITGSERLPFNGSKQSHRDDRVGHDAGHKGVRITYGPPFSLPTEVDGQRVDAALATDLMMRKVAEMLPETYRGIYGKSVS